MNGLSLEVRRWIVVFLLNIIAVFFLSVKGQSPGVESSNSLAYNLLLNEALSIQLECDSMASELLLNRVLYREAIGENEKTQFKASIEATELLLRQKQKIVDKLFSKAQELKKALKEADIKEDEESIELAKDVNGLKVYTYLLESKVLDKDSVEIKVNCSTRNEAIENNATNFEILSASPYSSAFPIPENEVIPDGLIYRVQLGVFGNKQPENIFGGLSPISAEKVNKQLLTTYFVGYFVSLKEAHSALEEVKGLGFKDAFVVSYFEKQRISINAARELEFGQKLDTN